MVRQAISHTSRGALLAAFAFTGLALDPAWSSEGPEPVRFSDPSTTGIKGGSLTPARGSDLKTRDKRWPDVGADTLPEIRFYRVKGARVWP